MVQAQAANLAVIQIQAANLRAVQAHTPNLMMKLLPTWDHSSRDNRCLAKPNSKSHIFPIFNGRGPSRK